MPDQSHLDQRYFVDEDVYNCPFCKAKHTFDGARCRRQHPLPPTKDRKTHYTHLGIDYKIPKSGMVTDLKVFRERVTIE